MSMDNTNDNESVNAEPVAGNDSPSHVAPDSMVRLQSDVARAVDEPMSAATTPPTVTAKHEPRGKDEMGAATRERSFPWIPIPANLFTGKPWKLLSADARSLVASFIGAYWEDGCRGLPVSATSLARLIPVHWKVIKKNLDALQSFLELEIDESHGEPVLRCSLLDERWLHAKELSDSRSEIAKNMHAKARANAKKQSVQMHCDSEQQQDPSKMGIKQQQPQAPTLPPHGDPTRENSAAAEKGNLPVPMHGQDAGGQDPDAAAALELLTGSGIGLSHRLSRKFIDAEFYRNSCTGNLSWRLPCLKAAVEKLQLKKTSGRKVENTYGFLKTLYEEAVAEKEDGISRPETVQNPTIPKVSGEFYFHDDWLIMRMFINLCKSKEDVHCHQAFHDLQKLLPTFSLTQQQTVARRVRALCEEKQLIDRTFDRIDCRCIPLLTEICRQVYEESQ